MNRDIFNALDQAGFGSNVHEIAAEGECRVLRIDDESGEGFMTMYRVLDGIYLMYNDFHLKHCVSEYQNSETVLCIDHCREGRIEHENSLGSRYYMEAGDLRIDKRVHHEGKVELPLSHYHGVTIGFLQDSAQESLSRELPFLSVDLDKLGEKFCPENKEFLLRTNEQLNAVLSQLYHAPKSIRLDYFKVKIAELLLLLSTMLLFYDWRIGLILCGGLVVFFMINSGLMKASAGMAKQKIEKDSALVAKVIEYIQGIFEVRTFRLTGKRSKDLNTAIDENENANSAMELKLIPFMTMQSFWLKALGTIIVLVSVILHIDGKMDLLTTIIMIISSYLIYAQLDNAGKYSALLRTVDASVKQAQEILATPQMDISGRDIQPEHFDISAENIGFSYDQRKIIDGVTLKIPEHTTTAIVGPSGGGKTTLTSLLSRFWDVDEGRVMLDGKDVREYSMDALMKNYSFVFQRVYLFADTIANNIRFGQPDAPMEKEIDAAKKACCHDFIMELPEGYETVIGEGGASLSGGEKQRISIARAIMKDSPVIVLDEATANVDPENEADLIEAIDALTKEKTIIMIVHRLKTVRNADQIVVIENGRIAQQGTHNALMQEDGIYRNFVESRREAASWRL